MDEMVASRYRGLMQAGFPHSGSLENPTMFIDTKAEGVSICGHAGQDYMNIYIRVAGGVLEKVKYLCSCDPTANVVVETLCDLAEGRTLAEAKALTKEQFYQAIGTDAGSVTRKVWGAVELLNRVINRHEMRLAEAKQTR
jgi:NifU-like protein involved in Fe-S cluster formation